MTSTYDLVKMLEEAEAAMKHAFDLVQATLSAGESLTPPAVTFEISMQIGPRRNFRSATITDMLEQARRRQAAASAFAKAAEDSELRWERQCEVNPAVTR